MKGARKLSCTVLLAALAASVPAAAQTLPAPPAPTGEAPQPQPQPQPQAPSADAARADALFQEGKRLLEQGKFEAACSLLAQSDQLDPAISAIGLLAACHEQQGRLATAWKEYRETARRADAAADARAEFAKQRAAALDLRLPRLLIRASAPVPGLEIRVDGELVPAAQLGEGFPIDPGTHEIVAHAQGRVDYRAGVTAKEGALLTIDVPALALVPRPSAAPATPAPAAPPDQPASGSSRLPGVLVAGSVGLAGLGVGIGAGVSALGKNLESTRIYNTCKAPGAPPGACAEGRDLRNGAYTASTVSTVGFCVGAAGIVTAAAVLLWPRAKATPAQQGLTWSPVIGSQGGGMTLGGSF